VKVKVMVVSKMWMRLPFSEFLFHVVGDFVDGCERISGESDGSEDGDR